MTASPYASDAKIAEACAAIGADLIGQTEQTLLQQLVVAAAVGGGGSTPSATAWGGIVGVLADQTDLQTALNAKLPLTGGTLIGPLTITGGTVVTSTPLLVQSQTWNAVGQAFKANTMAVTNTASKAYSATWADVSTLIDLACDGVTKFAVIPKGSENQAMVRIGGSDGAHVLLKDSATGGVIVRRSDSHDLVALGWMGNGTTGVTIAAGSDQGCLGFNGTNNVMGGGNSAADAFFKRAGAAAAIQMGANSATPIDQIFKGPNGSGTNIAGGDIRIAPGQSTGNATPATVVLQGTGAGESSTTAQTLVDLLTVGDGLVKIESGNHLQLGNVAAPETPTASHTLIIKDGDGTSYKVLCVPA